MNDDRFIEEYRPLVAKIAGQLHRSLGLQSELDDLLGFGFRGLLEARSRYDASRGVQFNTFAYYRIRGAIIDGVRAMAYLPRRAHARLKAAEAANRIGETLGESLATSARAGSSPDGEEAAREVQNALAQLSTAYVVSAVAPSEQQVATPEALLRSKARAEEVHAAVDALPTRERTLVRGFYFEGRRFDEVAQEIGISKSWASRLHAKALERLRASLAE